MTKDINIEFKTAYTRRDLKSITSMIQYELEDFMEVYNVKRIVTPIANTIESISLVAILKPYISRGLVDLIFISEAPSKRLIPKNLENFLRWVNAKPIIISLDKEIFKILRAYIPKTSKEALQQSIKALILRKYADNKGAIIIRPYTYTHWILGAFDDIEFKTTDYLPFIRIYYSNVKKISHLYSLDRYFSKAQLDQRIKKIMNDINIPSIDKLDSILKSISLEYMELDENINREMDIPVDTIEKLNNIIKVNSLKKSTPTPIP